jgi:pilus assembly protein Flp/PilA
MKLLNVARKFLGKKDEGASLVEYGLLVGLIAVACIAAITAVSTDIQGLFTTIGTALKAA